MNAKEEFLETTKDIKVIAAKINIYNEYYYEDDENNHYELKLSYTKEDYDNFLNSIDIDYDDGFGGQELHGVIFCEDGIWFDRGEYDGSEWWNKHEYPKLEEYFKESDVLKYKRSLKIKNIEKNN